MNNKRPLVVLTGPTAVGKTKLSIELAKKINGEIISCDSMQVYKYMDVGSAKIKPEEMRGVKHHLVDVLEPTEDFHVVEFQKMAKKAIDEIYANGHVPVLVGGTGFYIQAVLYDIDFTESDEDQAYRKELQKIAEEKGQHFLHEMLKAVDEKAAEDIHENNVKRVIRALEFYKETGEKISEHNEEQRAKSSPYAFKYFVLNDEREKLYKNIDKRVDIMFEEGLVDEVKKLISLGCHKGLTSMQGIGYKEVIDFLEEKASYEDTVSKIKQETRRFAKRQLTWFRREKDVIWLDKDKFAYDDQKMLEYVVKCCEDIL